MDAVTYLKEKARMTDNCNIWCLNCPLNSSNNGVNILCEDLQIMHPEEAVAIVEKWSKENPLVTIQERFLEMFPDAPLKEDGTPKDICPRGMGYADSYNSCKSCKECWSQPYVKKS